MIVFAGVYFMAETAKILAPERTVLIPDPAAGCSLADSITAEQVRAWKAEHPGAAVVAYVNTSAEVKAESDVCCTSANAAEIVSAIPADREVLFLPDQFLGAHVRRVTGRPQPARLAGRVPRARGHQPAMNCAARRPGSPDAELFVHPECGCATAALWQAGTGDLPAGAHPGAVHRRDAGRRAADPRDGRAGGHRDRDAAPAAAGQPGGPLGAGQSRSGLPVHEDDTPAALLRCLRDGVTEVQVAAGGGGPGPPRGARP